MNPDPEGYYARLQVGPTAAPEAIVASYRRLARVLHPDVAGTGDAEAFIRLHQAYEVLSDPDQRAAYDHAARQTVVAVMRPMAAAAVAPELDLEPEPDPESRPHLSDLPLAVWLGFIGVIGVAGVIAMIRLFNNLAEPPAPPPAAQQIALPRPAAPVATLKPTGMPTHYVLPTGGPAMVWRFDPAVGHYVLIGKFDPFSAVQALHDRPRDGMLEIALEGGGSGFVDATRLMPGDQMAAHRAYCIDTAGSPPVNGQVLVRHGSGTAHLQLENHAELSSVVKLRDADGALMASVFLAPHSIAVVDQLPAGRYRAEFAFGELWSQSCGAFAAGMRAERFAGAVDLSDNLKLVIPPGLSGGAMPVDIPDATFERP